MFAARARRAPWVGALVLAAGACAGDSSPLTPDADPADPIAPVAPTVSSSHQRAAIARGVVALSVDDRGVPRMVRAVRPLPAAIGASPGKAALAHVTALAAAYVDGGALAELEVVGTRVLGTSTIVSLRQLVGGVEILDGDVRVLVDRDGALVAISGTPRAPTTRTKAFTLNAAQALAAAVGDRFGVAATAADVIRQRRDGAWHRQTMRPVAGVTIGDTHARQVMVPDGDALVAGWLVEGYGGTSAEPDAAFGVVLAADTGRVIERRDLTAEESYDYRVWADDDAAGRPYEGPQASFAPHPTGVNDGSQPAFVLPNLVTMAGFDRHGDPWLPDGAGETLGNNVDAYVDLLGTANGFTAGVDFRADTTAAGTFDRTYDVTLDAAASPDQQKAAITQLFYTVNWLHDWYYDSGFDEAAGNAQADNLGRGGVAGDVLRAEAQDDLVGGSMNNANMSTPSDGLSPRMQMFVWNGVGTRSLSTSAGGAIASTQGAAFGLFDYDVEAEVVLGVDATAPVNNGCEALTGDVTGKIVLLDRGLCTFESKVLRAQQAGAAGVLVANNAATGLPSMGNDPATTGVTIGAFGISQADGAALKAALATPPVTAHLIRDEPRRDGDLDVTVIAHEWGHYMHHRLTSCSGGQCGAMSEGWGDFVALHNQLRPEDDPHAVYPMAVYDTISLGDAYYGIRRGPYSTDRTKNGLSFRHLGNANGLPVTSPPMLTSGPNNEVHNAGEVWAATLWDGYVALIDAHDYDTARRAMSDYVVAGLLLAPPDGTFTETRDAILLATFAIDADDALVLAGSFAGRGMGSCAASPTDAAFNTVVESMAVAGRLEVGAITLDDSGVTCDDDGIFDAGETATLTVEVVNSGAVALAAIDVSLSTASPGLTIVDDTVTTAVGAFSARTLVFSVRYDPAVAGATTIDFGVTAGDAAACNTSAASTATFDADYDDDAALSAIDTVDSAHEAWTKAGANAAATWSRQLVTGDWAWRGLDQGFASDTSLTSPPLVVGAGLVVTFDHRFSFEFDGTYWDGGVIEASTDDGATWADVTTLGVAPGYNGTINGHSGNPLEARAVFGASNPAYPARDAVTLDFGDAFAGQTVRLRFRIGTDGAAGGFGWELDNLAFDGITNTPFGVLSGEDPTCQVGPIADAGDDAVVVPGGTVVVDGTGTHDPNGDPITVTWLQVGGVPVTLQEPTTTTPRFVAPDGSVDLRLTFRVTATDPWATASDLVVYTVDVDNTPPPVVPDAGPAPDAASPVVAPDAQLLEDVDAAPSPDAGGVAEEDGDDGGCCSTGGGMPTTGALAPLFALALVLRRRRIG